MAEEEDGRASSPSASLSALGAGAAVEGEEESTERWGICRLLGSKENGMGIMEAPTELEMETGNNSNNRRKLLMKEEDLEVVDLLRLLDKLLQKRFVRKKLNDLLDAGDTSVRLIQAERYELFLDAPNKPSTAFDDLAQHLHRQHQQQQHQQDEQQQKQDEQQQQDGQQDGQQADGAGDGGVKDKILRFAIRRARLDSRLSCRDYNFGCFSLLVSFDPASAQAPHIDVIRPNYQFGLIVTDSVPGTLFYTPTTTTTTTTTEHQNDNTTTTSSTNITNISSVDDLVKVWSNSILRRRKMELPTLLIHTMKHHPEIQILLQGFGNVLLPPNSLQQIQPGEQLSTGTVLSLPGNVVHAGPKSTSFRAVIFFSASPSTPTTTTSTQPTTQTTNNNHHHTSTQNVVVPYDPDTQFTSVLLCAYILSLLWNSPGIKPTPHRFTLLRILQWYIESSSVRGMWKHFGNNSLSRFLQILEIKCDEYKRKRKRKGLASRRQDMESFLELTSMNDELCSVSTNAFSDDDE